MKKVLLLGAMGCFVLGANAQNAPYHFKKDPAQFKVAVERELPLTGFEMPMAKIRPSNPAEKPTVPFAKSYTETVIGHSYYDTQTNGCMQKRMIRDGQDLHAAWTMAQEPGFADRGTGYVSYTPSTWDNEPLERIENVRVGWPSLLQTGNGRILSITHSGAPYHLILTYRDAGDAAWSQIDIPTNLPGGLLWGHATIGGPNNNTIHLIGLSTPTAFGGELVDGQDGSLRYFRSTDEGNTWEVQDFLIPGMGIDDFLSFGPDSYDIHSRGERVIIGTFNEWADSKVFISEDGGDNWTPTTLFDFPIDLFQVDIDMLDEDGDFLPDTAYSTDGSGQVYIDMAGQAHAIYGDMLYLDQTLGDGTWSYFPGVDGLNYWNESYGPTTAQYVGYLLDADGSGLFEFADEIAAYGTGSTAHGTIGEDAMGNIYVVYAGLVETHATGTQNFRHLFATKTVDGGETFSEPVDITPDVDFIYYEYAYPCMAPVVDDRLHIVAQRDDEPGTSLTDDDPVAENSFVYLGVDVDFSVDQIDSVDDLILDNQVSVYPNPASNMVSVQVDNLSQYNLDIYDITGKLVLSQQQTRSLSFVDISDLAPGLYTISISNNGNAVSEKLIVE